jgi:hypothetical protein
LCSVGRLNVVVSLYVMVINKFRPCWGYTISMVTTAVLLACFELGIWGPHRAIEFGSGLGDVSDSLNVMVSAAPVCRGEVEPCGGLLKHPWSVHGVE